MQLLLLLHGLCEKHLLKPWLLDRLCPRRYKRSLQCMDYFFLIVRIAAK